VIGGCSGCGVDTHADDAAEQEIAGETAAPDVCTSRLSGTICGS
jgi:hypothetical protein